jgi:hypothetical protein
MEETDEIISFDLGDKRVTPVKTLHVQVEAGDGWSCQRLTEVHGRLGMAIFCSSRKDKKTKVWLLESASARVMTLGLQVKSVVSTEYFPHKYDSRVISNARGMD